MRSTHSFLFEYHLCILKLIEINSFEIIETILIDNVD